MVPRGDQRESLTLRWLSGSSTLALSGAGSDGLRFSHLQSIIRTQFGQEQFGASIEAFWRRVVDDPDAFPPEFWELFLQ